MALELTPIAAAQPRQHVRLAGKILSVTYSPSSSLPLLTAVLSDGEATIELRWPGRRSISGISVGQRIEVQGTIMPATGQNVLVHPLYRILSVSNTQLTRGQ